MKEKEKKPKKKKKAAKKKVVKKKKKKKIHVTKPVTKSTRMGNPLRAGNSYRNAPRRDGNNLGKLI